MSGDARGSSQNDLAAELLGDYVSTAATRTYGVSETAEAEEPGGDREEGEDQADATAPDVQQESPATFGNSDIFGWSSVSAP